MEREFGCGRASFVRGPPAAADVLSAYDLAGRRTSARFASTSGQGVIYAFDTAGRLASEANTIGTSRALSFLYDAASNRTRITWPDAYFAAYDYDAMNRVSAIRENGAASGAGVLGTYAYDALGRRATVTRGNGTVSTFAYDTASRLTGLTQNLDGAATANDQTFGFGYTAASQVSSRTAANDNYNWVGQTIANRTYARNGLNQYTNVGGVNYSYDLRGNLTSDGARAFVYDLENRLLSMNGAAFALSYDPLGRLRQTNAASVTTDFLYDGDRLLAEYNAAGAVLRRYVHGPGVDEPLVWCEGSGTTDRRYLIADHQGSVIAENGATTTRYNYGPYGEPSTWLGSRFRYTGQIALPEAQLYHYKARVYCPECGRFLQTDPVGYEDDFNLYAYVRNDPLNARDPRGMDTITLGPELEITPFIGFSVGYGLAVSFPTPWDPGAEWDIGGFGYISGRAGLHAVAGVASYSPRGSVSDLGGFSGELSGTRGALTGNVTFPIRRGGEGEPALVFGGAQEGGSAGAGMRVRGQSADVPMPGRTQGSLGVGGSAGIRAGGTVSFRSVERALGGGARVRENRDGSVTVSRPREGSRIQERTTCRTGENGRATCN